MKFITLLLSVTLCVSCSNNISGITEQPIDSSSSTEQPIDSSSSTEQPINSSSSTEQPINSSSSTDTPKLVDTLDATELNLLIGKTTLDSNILITVYDKNNNIIRESNTSGRNKSLMTLINSGLLLSNSNDNKLSIGIRFGNYDVFDSIVGFTVIDLINTTSTNGILTYRGKVFYTTGSGNSLMSVTVPTTIKIHAIDKITKVEIMFDSCPENAPAIMCTTDDVYKYVIDVLE